MIRHLPPVATPLALADLRHGLHAPADTPIRFQRALARYLGANSCALASSGRAALYLLLRRLAAGQPERTEVVLPAYTCPALIKVTLDVGLRPCLVDVSPHTLAFAPEHLAASLHEDTLAVICVHPFGIPQATEAVIACARAAGAVVIEDAAQSMGAQVSGQPVGTRGDFGLFSLGPGKPFSTGGGGILCANNETGTRLLAEAWQGLTPGSTLAAGWAMMRLVLLALAFHPVGWWLATRAGLHRVGNQEASWGYRVSGLAAPQAAVGLALLPQLNDINARRYHNARQLMTCLQDLDFVQVPLVAPTAAPIYLRLPLIIDSEERRERLLRRLWAASIGAGRMYRHALPELFPQLATRSYPGAATVARRLLTLPTHHYLTDEDISRMKRTLIDDP